MVGIWSESLEPRNAVTILQNISLSSGQKAIVPHIAILYLTTEGQMDMNEPL